MPEQLGLSRADVLISWWSLRWVRVRANIPLRVALVHVLEYRRAFLLFRSVEYARGEPPSSVASMANLSDERAAAFARQMSTSRSERRASRSLATPDVSALVAATFSHHLITREH